MLTELSQWMAAFCRQTRTCWMFVNTHQEESEGATAQGLRLPLQQSQQASEVQEGCRCSVTILQPKIGMRLQTNRLRQVQE